MEDVSSIMEYLENSIQQNPDFNFSSIANDLSNQSSIKEVQFGGKTFMYEEKPGKNVGSVIWSSATFLADFLCTQNLTDQIVVDLGAGIGLLSLVAAGQGANVISTELSESLPDLQKSKQMQFHVLCVFFFDKKIFICCDQPYNIFKGNPPSPLPCFRSLLSFGT